MEEAIRNICDSISRRVDRAYVAECGRRIVMPQKLFDLWKETGLLALGLPEAGTNTFKIRTSAISQPDGSFLINGKKTYQTGFVESTHCLLVTRTRPYDDRDRKKGISLFIVDTRLPCISTTEMELGLYLPEKNYNAFYDNVRITPDCLVGEEGRGIQILFQSLNSERLIVAAQSVGQAGHILKRAADYAKVRAPFDAPIGSYQSIQHPMARAKVYTEATRALIGPAVEKYERGEPIGLEANMAKLMSSEAYKMAAGIAMIAFGGGAWILARASCTSSLPHKIVWPPPSTTRSFSARLPSRRWDCQNPMKHRRRGEGGGVDPALLSAAPFGARRPVG